MFIYKGKNCKYVVAHPSRIKLSRNNILETSMNETQTIHKFLKQIYQYLLSNNEILPNKKHNIHHINNNYNALSMPIITVEMKFTDIIHQLGTIYSI